MMKSAFWVWVILLSTWLPGQTQIMSLDTLDLARYEAEAAQLVSFLQFTLNTVGDSLTSAREKDIIIQQSYRKIFRDEKVQIEDDLIANRSTVTNKDVQAYLKDIDFFYRYARFELQVESISHELAQSGELYFKVALTRKLEGISQEGDTVFSILPRFIEINLNPEARTLKIASFYTTRLSEEERLAEWWNGLSYDWKRLFADEVSLDDSLDMRQILAFNDTLSIGDTLRLDGRMHALTSARLFEDLKQLVRQEKLDLSDNPSIIDLEPLSQLTELRQLDISGTAIYSLVPIRNLTHLEFLNCANSRIRDLSPLEYAWHLKELICDHTQVQDLSVLASFSKLQRLSCANSAVADLQPLANLGSLEELNLSYTRIRSLSPLAKLSKLKILTAPAIRVQDLTPLASCTSLEQLNLEDTPVRDLTPLSANQQLRLLFLDHAEVQALMPLGHMPNLRKIYCDHTPIKREEALRYMELNPQCLVVNESGLLRNWWDKMGPAWQNIFAEQISFQENPNREELQEMAKLKTLDISHRGILNLQPIEVMVNLEWLTCAHTPIEDLSPLRDLIHLKQLDCQSTRVRDLTPLKDLVQLTHLNLAHTAIDSLDALSQLHALQHLTCDYTAVNQLAPLQGLSKLSVIYADECELSDQTVKQLLARLPQCLVVYRSAYLFQWWDGLAPIWRENFQRYLKGEAQRENLHQLTQLHSLVLNGQHALNDLSPLQAFLTLKQLKFTDTQVTDLQPLAEISTLEGLECSRNPISDLSPLAALYQLRHLAIENTPVSDLRPLANLSQLEVLVANGTQIRKLNDLGQLRQLKQLECANTEVKTLNPLEGHDQLRRLVCYNTRLNASKVQKFRLAHPSCEVVYY